MKQLLVCLKKKDGLNIDKINRLLSLSKIGVNNARHCFKKTYSVLVVFNSIRIGVLNLMFFQMTV